MYKTINPTPDREGYEMVEEEIGFYNSERKSLHGTQYPGHHVWAIIEHDMGRVCGTVLDLSSSIDPNTEHGVTEYNGFFLKLRASDTGHVNVYADPGSGGASVLYVEDWEGNGARTHKYPIQNIKLELNSVDPVCRCGETMLFGISKENENTVTDGDGSSGRYMNGWLCPECFPGHIREKNTLP